jgi:nitrogen-specific signal transduction histidine kinase
MTQIEDTPEKLIQAMRAMDQAVIKSITAAQQRSMNYARGLFEGGVETFKENTRDTRTLMESLIEQPSEPQQAFQAVMSNAVAVQERNIKYAQDIMQSGVEVLKGQIESNRTLMYALAEQSQKQQEALQKLTQEFMKESLRFFIIPFSFYQKVTVPATK